MTEMTISFHSTAEDVWHQLYCLGYRTVVGRILMAFIISVPLLSNVLILYRNPVHSPYRHFLAHNFWIVNTGTYLFDALIFAFASLIAVPLAVKITSRYTLTISEEGRRFYNGFSEKIPWRRIKHLTDEGDYFFFTGWRAAIYVPKRAFQSQAEADAFFERAVKYWHEAKGLPVPVRAASDLSEVWPPAPLPQNSAELDGNRNG